MHSKHMLIRFDLISLELLLLQKSIRHVAKTFQHHTIDTTNFKQTQNNKPGTNKTKYNLNPHMYSKHWQWKCCMILFSLKGPQPYDKGDHTVILSPGPRNNSSTICRRLLKSPRPCAKKVA